MSKQLKEAKEYFFASMYQFTSLKNLFDLRDKLYTFQKELVGLVILAEEGINGTIAGPQEQVKAFVRYIQREHAFQGLELKYSQAIMKRVPFRKLKIKIKQEIVTLGINNLDTLKFRGDYIEPEDWNALIEDPEVLVIDTRNVYEHRIGTFMGSRDPRTLNFRHFPRAIKKIINEAQPKKIAMFCTGGIRCEKATAYVKQLGVDKVYHLHGGILKYLENIPNERSLWNGKCFVFDGRITVNQNLEAEPEPFVSFVGR